jgi:hypothetical protein
MEDEIHRVGRGDEEFPESLRQSFDELHDLVPEMPGNPPLQGLDGNSPSKLRRDPDRDAVVLVARGEFLGELEPAVADGQLIRI